MKLPISLSHFSSRNSVHLDMADWRRRFDSIRPFVLDAIKTIGSNAVCLQATLQRTKFLTPTT